MFYLQLLLFFQQLKKKIIVFRLSWKWLFLLQFVIFQATSYSSCNMLSLLSQFFQTTYLWLNSAFMIEVILKGFTLEILGPLQVAWWCSESVNHSVVSNSLWPHVTVGHQMPMAPYTLLNLTCSLCWDSYPTCLKQLLTYYKQLTLEFWGFDQIGFAQFSKHALSLFLTSSQIVGQNPWINTYCTSDMSFSNQDEKPGVVPELVLTGRISISTDLQGFFFF